jgi:amidohydrolase
MTAMARATATDVFGDRNAVIDNQTIASEDFSEFSTRVPGVFMFLGTGSAEKGTAFPHHNPRFNIDEDVLLDGVAMHAHGALNFLTRFTEDKGGE